MKTLGIGMAGYGFIGRVHTISYLNLPFYYRPLGAELKMVGVCSYPIKDAEDGVKQAGFEFATEDYMAVFIPMSYQIGGVTIMVPKDQVHPIDMSVEQGLRFAATAGMPAQQKKPTPKDDSTEEDSKKENE